MSKSTRNNDAPKNDLVRAVFQPGAELRADMTPDDGDDSIGNTLFGHLAVFNKWTEIRSPWEGNFMEMMAPGSFTKTINENRSNIKVLYDHGMDPQLGNKPLGPIQDLREDGQGCYYEVPLIDTDYNRNFVKPAAAAGLLGASFRFNVVRDEWNDMPKPSGDNPKGIPERVIREVKMAEFGPVTFPAYTAATAGVRGRQEFSLWRDLEDDERATFAEFIVRARFKNDAEANAETDDTKSESREAGPVMNITVNVAGDTDPEVIAQEIRNALTTGSSTTTTNESETVVETQELRTSEDEVADDTEPDGAEDVETPDDDAATSSTDDVPAEEPPADRSKTTQAERKQAARRALLINKGIIS